MIMKSASVLAKQYGLERYLNDSAALNENIFKMMLLQEALQHEKARRKKGDVISTVISVKRKAAGKFTASSRGDEKYRYAVETALRASTDVLSVFHRRRFVNMLVNMGIPACKIEEFSESIILDDDTLCIDPE
jgi:hypothetical protein